MPRSAASLADPQMHDSHQILCGILRASEHMYDNARTRWQKVVQASDDHDLSCQRWVGTGGRLRQPGPAAQPRDVALVPESRQREQCLLPTAQPGFLPGAGLAAMSGQQPVHEKGHFPGHVEHDMIGNYAEHSPARKEDFGETFSTGGSASALDLTLCSSSIQIIGYTPYY